MRTLATLLKIAFILALLGFLLFVSLMLWALCPPLPIILLVLLLPKYTN